MDPKEPRAVLQPVGEFGHVKYPCKGLSIWVLYTVHSVVEFRCVQHNDVFDAFKDPTKLFQQLFILESALKAVVLC